MSNETKTFTGRIYIIRNEVDDLVYVGSTTQTLAERMAEHRRHSKMQKTSSYKIYQHFREIGVEKFHIELLESNQFSTKEELRARENHYIRRYDSLKGGLNKKLALEDNERKNENREYSKDYYHNFQKEKKKELYVNNKTEMKNRSIENCKKVKENKKYYCSICDYAFHCPTTLSDHLLSKNHVIEMKNQLFYIGEDCKEILVKDKFCCLVCNVSVSSNGSLARHLNTKKHASQMQDQLFSIEI